MWNIDLNFEGDVPRTSPKQLCSECGKPLARYNKTGRCYHHPDPKIEQKRREREERLAQEAARKQKLEEDAVERAKCPAAELVVDLVCKECGVTVEQLREQNRRAEIVRARHILMYLLYKDTPMTYPAIGAFLGDRDHTTVLHGVGAMEETITTDVGVRDSVERIRAAYPLPLISETPS